MTPVAFVSQMYRFMSGSLRYAVLDMTTPSTTRNEHLFVTSTRRVVFPGMLSVTAQWYFKTIADTIVDMLGADLMVFSSGPEDNSISFTVPMNYNGRGKPTRLFITPRMLEGNGVTLSFYYPVSTGFNDVGDSRIMFQAGGDDFSCFALTHTPTIVTQHV